MKKYSEVIGTKLVSSFTNFRPQIQIFLLLKTKIQPDFLFFWYFEALFDVSIEPFTRNKIFVDFCMSFLLKNLIGKLFVKKIVSIQKFRISLWKKTYYIKNIGKNIFSLWLITNHSQSILKNLTFLTPNISQFSKQDDERFLLKNNIDSREHVFKVRGLSF